MSNKKYAQISQDACGILKISETNEWFGLFTDSVESCAIYVFEGQNKVVMCHDSGQMSLEKIVDIVSDIGRIKGFQMLCHEHRAFHTHVDRKLSLCEKLNFSASAVEELSCSQQTFAAVYDLTQRLRATKNESPDLLEPPSDIAYRWAVAKLNNAFIEPNSQILPSNLQFDGDYYLPAMKPILNLREILKIVRQQPNYLFMNLSVLLLAHKKNVLVLPTKLLEFSKNHNITENNFINDARLQARAFEIFKAQRLHTVV